MPRHSSGNRLWPAAAAAVARIVGAFPAALLTNAANYGAARGTFEIKLLGPAASVNFARAQARSRLAARSEGGKKLQKIIS